MATGAFLLGTSALLVSLLVMLVAQGPNSASCALTRLPAVIDDLERAPFVGRWLSERDAATTIADQLDQLPGRIANTDGAVELVPDDPEHSWWACCGCWCS